MEFPQQNSLPVPQTDLPNCPDFPNCAGHAMCNALNTATLYSKQHYHTLRNLTTNQNINFEICANPGANTNIKINADACACQSESSALWIEDSYKKFPKIFNLQSSIQGLEFTNSKRWIVDSVKIRPGIFNNQIASYPNLLKMTNFLHLFIISYVRQWALGRLPHIPKTYLLTACRILQARRHRNSALT